MAADGVAWTTPKNNATVAQSFETSFTVSGLTVAPASDGLKDGTGHHHILVDLPPMPAGEVIPKDETHIHLGKGQESATLELAPGKHTLTLQFANALHESYGEKFSKTITVNVK